MEERKIFFDVPLEPKGTCKLESRYFQLSNLNKNDGIVGNISLWHKQCIQECPKTCKKTSFEVVGESFNARHGVGEKFVIEMASSDVERYEVVPKYDWFVLVANFGGMFGLFTGFSVLTGIEILILLFDLTFSSIKRITKR